MNVESNKRTYKDFAKYLGEKPRKLGKLSPILRDIPLKITKEELNNFIETYCKGLNKSK